MHEVSPKSTASNQVGINVELLRYRCLRVHKVVLAFQILNFETQKTTEKVGGIVNGVDGTKCRLDEEGFARVFKKAVADTADEKGYLVLYDDDHVSYSRADGIEDGTVIVGDYQLVTCGDGSFWLVATKVDDPVPEHGLNS